MAPHNSQLVRLGRVPRVDHEALAQTRVRGNDRKVITRYGQNGSNVQRERGHAQTDVSLYLVRKMLFRTLIDHASALAQSEQSY